MAAKQVSQTYGSKIQDLNGVNREPQKGQKDVALDKLTDLTGGRKKKLNVKIFLVTAAEINGVNCKTAKFLTIGRESNHAIETLK